jgi:protein-tyrosine-phosphatase
MKSVIFVCTANRCRSPMAMGLFRDKLIDQPDEWQVGSAGTWAVEGEPAMSYVQKMLLSKGIDISEHLSAQVTGELLSEYNLVLAMEKGHKEGLRVEFPGMAGKIFLLSEMVGQVFDIPDPVGGPPAEYEMTLREIDQLLTKGFDKISQLAERS